MLCTGSRATEGPSNEAGGTRGNLNHPLPAGVQEGRTRFRAFLSSEPVDSGALTSRPSGPESPLLGRTPARGTELLPGYWLVSPGTRAYKPTLLNLRP